ncbi:unnamed protein product [Urochloa humidicola]
MINSLDIKLMQISKLNRGKSMSFKSANSPVITSTDKSAIRILLVDCRSSGPTGGEEKEELTTPPRSNHAVGHHPPRSRRRLRVGAARDHCRARRAGAGHTGKVTLPAVPARR